VIATIRIKPEAKGEASSEDIGEKEDPDLLEKLEILTLECEKA
jgi:hypothetical protein